MPANKLKPLTTNPTPRSVSLEGGLWDKLDKTAKAMAVTRTALIRRIITEWFERNK